MRTRSPLTLVVLALGLAGPAAAEQGDWQQVEEGLGVTGFVQPGDVYKVSLPRTDLVTADGLEVKPALALGSW